VIKVLSSSISVVILGKITCSSENCVLVYIPICAADGQWIFEFSVKFYPPDPSIMQEEITRSVTVVQQLPLQILPASFVRMHFVDMPSANVEVFFTFISTCFSCSMTVFAGQPEKKISGKCGSTRRISPWECDPT